MMSLFIRAHWTQCGFGMCVSVSPAFVAWWLGPFIIRLNRKGA